METHNLLEGTIEAITQPKDYQGKLQIGFMMSRLWYNIQGSKEELDIILKELIRKGNKIQFLYDPKTKSLKDLKVTQRVPEQEPPENGMWQDEMIRFEDLLSAAHDKEIPFSIKTECLKIDWEKKRVLFKATVEVINGTSDEAMHEVFTGHGDATEDNIQGSSIKPHYIRMAETRAIARALRWFTNNAKCSDVETETGENANEEPDDEKLAKA